MGSKFEDIRYKTKGCVFSKMGRRTTMEDEYVMVKFDEYMELYGVFDGHGGDKMVKVVKEELPEYIGSNLYKINVNDEEQVKKLLIKVFIKYDKYLYTNYEKIRSQGTTVTMILKIKDKLYIINLGDSRAVIFNSTREILMQTKDHKPELEIERINETGGKVIKLFGTSRVGGCLSVSRALGDFQEGLKLKNNKYQGINCSVGCIPDVCVYVPTTSVYALIATDGLWNAFTTKECIDMLMSAEDVKGACENLVNLSIHKSYDNVTAILIHI